jgi:hypothetical protein
VAVQRRKMASLEELCVVAGVDKQQLQVGPKVEQLNRGGHGAVGSTNLLILKNSWR